MTDLEYNLWEAVLGIRRRYGLITISQAKVQKLKALADACSGWIVFEDHLGETWLPTDVWVERFATWQKKGSESREI